MIVIINYVDKKALISIRNFDMESHYCSGIQLINYYNIFKRKLLLGYCSFCINRFANELNKIDIEKQTKYTTTKLILEFS